MNFLIFFFFLIGFSECFLPFFENTFLYFKDNSDVMLNEKSFNNEVIKRKDSFFDTLKNEDEEIRKKKCCLLGKRAGFRGFHCNLDFYSKSLINRVRNRTHRKHIKVLGNSKEHLINKQLIFKFSNCLNGQEMVFENCCWNEVESILKI